MPTGRAADVRTATGAAGEVATAAPKAHQPSRHTTTRLDVRAALPPPTLLSQDGQCDERHRSQGAVVPPLIVWPHQVSNGARRCKQQRRAPLHADGQYGWSP